MTPWETYRHVWVNLRGMTEEACKAKWKQDYPHEDDPLPLWQPSEAEWAALLS